MLVMHPFICTVICCASGKLIYWVYCITRTWWSWCRPFFVYDTHCYSYIYVSMRRYLTWSNQCPSTLRTSLRYHRICSSTCSSLNCWRWWMNSGPLCWSCFVACVGCMLLGKVYWHVVFFFHLDGCVWELFWLFNVSKHLHFPLGHWWTCLHYFSCLAVYLDLLVSASPLLVCSCRKRCGYIL